MVKRKQIHHQQCPLCDSSQIGLHCQASRNYASKDYQLRLARCAECGFVFLLNPPQIQYDEDYLHLEKVTTVKDTLAHFRAEERLVGIARVVAPEPEKRFLDIGIGDGLLLSLAERAGYTTFGLDVSKAGVKLARKLYRLRAEICLAPLKQAFPSTTFDVIHMNEVIEHIAQPMPLLYWCRAHLNERGCLVIQTGNIDSLASRLKGANWDYIRPVHVSYFSTRTLSYAVQKSGFKVLRRATIDWRLKSSLNVSACLLKHKGPVHALQFIGLYLTALWYGIRRTVLILAE